MITPALEQPPTAPSGLEVRKRKSRGSADGDAAAAGRCVEWDAPPPLPAPAAAASAITTYIIRTSVDPGRAQPKNAAAAADSEKKKEGELLLVSVEHSARLPTRLCQCNGWKIPIPKADDSDDAGADEDVLVTVRVVAENEAGRSTPAELTFTAPRSELIAAEEAAAADASPEDGCPELVEAPLTPPRDVMVLRMTAADGRGVLINWSAPLFESDLADAAERRNGASDADGGERGRSLLQEKGTTRSDTRAPALTIGYQVTWVGWDETNMPSVDPPVSVVLSSAGDEDVRRHATSPCGGGGDDGGDDDDARTGACFYAGLATSLRLEGLSDESSYAFAVRALTPGGAGPLSAPVVVPALRLASTSDTEDEDEDDDDDGAGSSTTTVDESDAEAEPDGQSVNEGIGADGSTSPDGNDTLPAAPPLTATEDAQQQEKEADPLPPLYEAERIGGVFDQIATPFTGTTQPTTGRVVCLSHLHWLPLHSTVNPP